MTKSIAVPFASHGLLSRSINLVDTFLSLSLSLCLSSATDFEKSVIINFRVNQTNKEYFIFVTSYYSVVATTEP